MHSRVSRPRSESLASLRSSAQCRWPLPAAHSTCQKVAPRTPAGGSPRERRAMRGTAAAGCRCRVPEIRRGGRIRRVPIPASLENPRFLNMAVARGRARVHTHNTHTHARTSRARRTHSNANALTVLTAIVRRPVAPHSRRDFPAVNENSRNPGAVPGIPARVRRPRNP